MNLENNCLSVIFKKLCALNYCLMLIIFIFLSFKILHIQ